MSFERSFFKFTFLMVGLGVVTACISDPTPMATVMLAATAPIIAAAYYWTVLREARTLSNRVASILSLLAFAATVGGVIAWFNVLSPFLHFLSFIQCLKLWQKKTSRDFVTLYAVSIIQVACGASISLDIQFGLLFFIYLVVGFWTLILFYLRREAEQGAGIFTGSPVANPITVLQSVQVRRAMGRGLPLMLLAFFAATAGLFLVLPRYRLRVLSVTTPASGKALAGFSQNIHLGEIGEIKDNAQPVMRIRLTRGSQVVQMDDSLLLWRGVSMDYYSRGEWRTTKFRNFQLHWQDGVWQTYGLQSWFHFPSSSFLYPYNQQAWPPVPNTDYPREDDLCQEITLDSTGPRVLFALHPAIDYRMLMPQDSQEITLEVQHWNASFDISTSRLSYQVYSRPQRWSENELGQATLVPNRLTILMKTYFLQLPQNLREDGRLFQLAQEIAAEAKASTPYQKVIAIRLWLERQCEYTRLPGLAPRGNESDPVMNFLYETRKGHCEYFATAQVLLTRALGIPARAVNGFRGGEWNDLGSFYLVRQRDAHSWAEVYLDRAGWIAVDPSPREAASTLLAQAAFFTKYFTFLQQLYDRSIIQYNPRQGDLISGELGQIFYDMRSILGRPAAMLSFPGMEEIQSLVGHAVLALVTLAALAGLGSLLLWALRGRWRLFASRFRAAEARSPIRFYQEMIHLLKRHGYERTGSTTPLEFSEQVIASAGADLELVRQITGHYYEARFSGRSLAETEQEEIRSLLARLKTALRPRLQRQNEPQRTQRAQRKT